MQLTSRKFAVLAGAVFLVATALTPAPAYADKAKTLKLGAIALGAISAYSILKGKTAVGAVAGAGAYYVYKKSQKAEQQDYAYNSGNDNYAYNDNYVNPDSNYSDTDIYSTQPGYYDNQAYPQTTYNNDGYDSSDYSTQPVYYGNDNNVNEADRNCTGDRGSRNTRANRDQGRTR